MPAPFTVPNRPTGSDPRAIADILSNFDAVTSGLDEIWNRQLKDGSIADDANIKGTKLLNNSVGAKKTKIEGQSTTGTGYPIIAQRSVGPGSYLVLAMSFGATGCLLTHTGGTATLQATDITTDASIGTSLGYASIHHGILHVTATTTLRLSGSGLGNQSGSLMVFGLND